MLVNVGPSNVDWPGYTDLGAPVGLSGFLAGDGDSEWGLHGTARPRVSGKFKLIDTYCVVYP